MCRKFFAVAVAAFALVLPAALPASAQTGPAGPRESLLASSSSFSCETTQPNGVFFRESDTIETIGDYWRHGTARPVAGSSGPWYDYYLGHVGDKWIYIQIDPPHGSFFVGTSPGDPSLPGRLDHSNWTIDYPSGQGSYRLSTTPTQFKIEYPNLTEVCSQQSSVAAPPVVPTQILKCDTWAAQSDSMGGSAGPSENYVTISKMDPDWWKASRSWFQGVGTTAKGGGSVIYEYNFFSVGNDWVSIAINPQNGQYTIAKSALSPDLNNTSWTMVYPTVEPAFTFRDVYPAGTLPQGFTVNFADGYQTCCDPNTPGPCPAPASKFPS